MISASEEMGWILANSIIQVYLNCTMGYGFWLTLTYERPSMKRYYNNKTERDEVKEMLVVDKIVQIIGTSCIAVFTWPWMLGYDLSRLECVLRGKNHEEYK